MCREDTDRTLTVESFDPVLNTPNFPHRGCESSPNQFGDEIIKCGYPLMVVEHEQVDVMRYRLFGPDWATQWSNFDDDIEATRDTHGVILPIQD